MIGICNWNTHSVFDLFGDQLRGGFYTCHVCCSQCVLADRNRHSIAMFDMGISISELIFCFLFSFTRKLETPIRLIEFSRCIPKRERKSDCRFVSVCVRSKHKWTTTTSHEPLNPHERRWMCVVCHSAYKRKQLLCIHTHWGERDETGKHTLNAFTYRTNTQNEV